MKIFPYEQLPKADLIIDAVYQGQSGSQLSGEALSKLFVGIGNQGGFRASGNGDDKRFVVLFTSGEDRDWPDSLDLHTGKFSYYGDNKKPGYKLHETQRGGNKILRHIFDLLHADPPQRTKIPPFFVFQKYPTKTSSRSFQYKGLAVPGFAGLPQVLDLIAVWKSTNGQRFQNYQATFTILDIAKISRGWIDDLYEGKKFSKNAPGEWLKWIQHGKYNALVADSTTVIRNREEQLPSTSNQIAILEIIWEHFKTKELWSAFEAFAARIFQMHDQRVLIDGITQATVDGGRDAIGRYLLGISEDPVYVEFSLEAKCYKPPLKGKGTSVRVDDVSRLISRIRNRQFGVLVTTSIISKNAYEEVREDNHPIIFLTGKDIVEILTKNGFNSPAQVKTLLENEFVISKDTL